MAGSSDYSFFLIGLSHKTAPVEVRERLSFEGPSAKAALIDIRGIEGVLGCVLLSTCNRTELYAVVDEPGDLARIGIGKYLIRAASGGEEIGDHFFLGGGKEAAAHLFRVTGGLDSMILGEPQILGQVKDAYSLASRAGVTCGPINRLFHHSFRVGKLIRSATSIGEGTVSVSVAAVEFARRELGGFEGRSILLVGAGKVGELCARRLAEAGTARLMVANRTAARASELAGRLGGKAVPFSRIPELCAEADIVITSASSREPILTREAVEPFIARRTAASPLVVVDLGVPRNVERSLAGCGCVRLYDIDDLDGMTLGNLERRLMEADKAEEIVRAEVDRFFHRLRENEVAPVIRGLHERFEAIRRIELEKVRNRLAPEVFAALDLVTRRIERKILHQPAVAIRSSETGGSRERIVNAVRELFIRDRDHQNPPSGGTDITGIPEDKECQ